MLISWVFGDWKLLAVVWNEVVKHNWTNDCVAVQSCNPRVSTVLLIMSSRARVDSPVSTASNDVTGISRWLRIAVRIRSSTGLRRESFDVLAGMSINPRYLGTINMYPVNMVEDSENSVTVKEEWSTTLNYASAVNPQQDFEWDGEDWGWTCDVTDRFPLYESKLRYKHSSPEGTFEVICAAVRTRAAAEGYVCSTVTCSYIIISCVSNLIQPST